MKFYDTCSLLLKVDNLFDEEFAISSITLNELEEIKTSSHKDPDIKYSARKLLHLLDENPEKYKVFIYTINLADALLEKHLTLTNDLCILATALYAKTIYNDLVFVTNDLALKNIAKMFFPIGQIESVNEDFDDNYLGYKEVYLNDEQMAYFYSNLNSNIYDLNINEYLIVYNERKNYIESYIWDGLTHKKVNYQHFQSKWFGDTKPMKNDPYQLLAIDSLNRNTITMLKGSAGSGKTILSFSCLMAALEHGKISKIIVFCNTVATKNSAKLGFYPGTRDEKLLDSQIGNLLMSKLGGRMPVEKMIADEQLVLLPLSDLRGYDTSGMNAGIYISEAQNMDIELMKLALQRIGSDSICIIDGDDKTQVDDIHFAGANNGMKRVSKVFRDHDIYGEVCLQNIHRSKIALLAEGL